MKRMAALFVLAGAVALLVAAGVAFAETIKCHRGGPKGEVCVGTDGPDRLFGSSVYNEMIARGGDDLLYGREGPDKMQGDESGQSTSPTDGDDQIYGNHGRDTLQGDGGSDLLKGGADDDYIDAAEFPRTSSPGSEDTVMGDGGDDEIVVYDFHPDAIDCGTGFDRVVSYDVGLDDLSENCEIQSPGS
jgi:Ca2+-binding RTX toxin-like protein